MQALIPTRYKSVLIATLQFYGGDNIYYCHKVEKGWRIYTTKPDDWEMDKRHKLIIGFDQ